MKKTDMLNLKAPWWVRILLKEPAIAIICFTVVCLSCVWLLNSHPKILHMQINVNLPWLFLRFLTCRPKRLNTNK